MLNYGICISSPPLLITEFGMEIYKTVVSMDGLTDLSNVIGYFLGNLTGHFLDHLIGQLIF